MVRITTVTVLDKFRVRLGLTNGKQKIVNLEPYLHGPIFEPIRKNNTLFKSVRVDNELGTIVWDNGADIDPDVLIDGLTPAWMETQHRYSSANKQSFAIKERKAQYTTKKKRSNKTI